MSLSPTAPAERLQRTIRADVRAMHAYAVQDAAGMIKLDAMENPFRLDAPLREALGRRLAEVELNRYPGARTDTLKAALRTYADVPSGYELMLGNGSDELIALLAQVCAQPGATVLAPLPGFVMYEISARLHGLQFVGVPLQADFELDVQATLAAIEKHRPALVYLAYPNNPTANLWSDAAIDQVVQAVAAQDQGFVIIDEAYQPFASKNYLDRLQGHPHVLLMRTLSKFGLAGVRLGYLIGPREVISEIDKARPPYNVSVLNCEAALFALEHADEFARQAQVLKAERQRVFKALQALPGVQPFVSEANMILVRVPDARAAFEGLKARGVLIKNVSGMHPLLTQCIRLTIGLPDENTALLAALQATLATSA